MTKNLIRIEFREALRKVQNDPLLSNSELNSSVETLVDGFGANPSYVDYDVETASNTVALLASRSASVADKTSLERSANLLAAYGLLDDEARTNLPKEIEITVEAQRAIYGEASNDSQKHSEFFEDNNHRRPIERAANDIADRVAALSYDRDHKDGFGY